MMVFVMGHVVVVAYTLELRISRSPPSESAKYVHYGRHRLVQWTRPGRGQGGRGNTFGADGRCHGLIDG